MSRYLSKTRIANWRQCPKRLWLEVHGQIERSFDPATELSFLQGHEVGAQARQRFGGGVLIGADDNLSQAIDDTASALAARPAVPLYEATFSHDGVLVRADVLVPEGRRHRLIEVKSAASVKDYHVEDIATQRWVLENAGVRTRSSTLMHVDSTWEYAGDGDYAGLFVEQDLTQPAADLAGEVPRWIEGARRTLAGDEPDIAMGEQCTSPFDCPYQDHCSAQAGSATEYPVTLLPNRLGKRVAAELAAEGHVDLRDVPAARLAAYPELALIHRCTVTGERFLDPAAAREIDRLPYPRAWLDFETIAFVVPRWPGTRPYQQVPFQWSCHIETGPGVFQHAEFIDLSGADPRRRCAEELVTLLRGMKTIVAYNASFERGRMADLAARFPDLAPALEAAMKKVWDLLPLVKRGYYHRDMLGSRSIKAVLPTVVDADPYAALPGVADGGAAQMAYWQAVQPGTTPQQRAELEAGLLAYCRTDTWAMIAVASALQGRALPVLK